MLYAQVSIVYLFTATTKVTPQWWDGWALEQQISTPWLRNALDSLGGTLGLEHLGIYAVIAHAVVFWQALACLAFVVPRLRVFACLTGPLFHIMVEVIGLEIRWFSYYMVAIYYLLLFPETWYAAVAKQTRRILAPPARLWSWLLRPRPLTTDIRTIIVLLGAGACAGFGLFGVLPGAPTVAIALALAVILAAYFGKGLARERTLLRVGLQVFAAMLVFAIPRYTQVGYNYYRFQGGDFSRRGEVEAAVDAYRQAVKLRTGPNSRHAKLARLLLQLGRYDEALENYRIARRHDPSNVKVLRGQATTLERMGRLDEANAIRQQLPRKTPP